MVDGDAPIAEPSRFKRLRRVSGKVLEIYQSCRSVGLDQLQPNPAVGDTIAEQRRVLHTIERLADWTLGDLVKGIKFWIVTSIAPAIAIGGVSTTWNVAGTPILVHKAAAGSVSKPPTFIR